MLAEQPRSRSPEHFLQKALDAIESNPERLRLYKRYYSSIAITGGEMIEIILGTKRSKKIIGFQEKFPNLSIHEIEEIRLQNLGKLAFGKVIDFFGISLEKAMKDASR